MSDTPEDTKPKTPRQEGGNNKRKNRPKGGRGSGRAAAEKSSPPAIEQKAEPAPGETGKSKENEGKPADKAPVQPPAGSERKSGKGGGMIGTVALLVALGAIAVGYNQHGQLQRDQAGLADRLDAVEGRLSTLDGSIQEALGAARSAADSAQSAQSSATAAQAQAGEAKAAAEAAVAKAEALAAKVEERATALEAKVGQSEELVARQLAEMKQQIESMLQTPDISKTDWLVAEVRHLIKMANHQALLAGNARAAAAALESADRRLAEIDDPSLLEVRKKLTDKIVALRGAPATDFDTIALTLASLEKEVERLPLKSAAPGAHEGGEAEEAGESGEVSGFEGFLDKVWNDVKGLVTVRRASEEATPALLPPGQQFFLQQNLRLKLEAARLALLQRDTTLFQSSIATARQWIERYFDTGATVTANMLTTLAPYEQMSLEQQLPDAGDVLTVLDAWDARRRAASGEGEVN